MFWKKRNEVIQNEKNKVSIVALIISLLPFITLLISLFTEEITGGLQMGLIALNVISVLSGFGLSISLIKIQSVEIYFLLLLCVFVLFWFAHGWYYCSGFNIYFYVRCAYEKYINCRGLTYF